MSELDQSSWDFLTGDTEKDHRNVRLVLDTLRSLSRMTDSKQQMLEAVERAVTVTGADQGFLFESRGGDLAVTVVVDRIESGETHRVPYSTSVVREVWKTGQPSIWTGLPPDVDPNQTLVEIGMESGMAVRLEFKHEPVGVLYVQAKQQRRDFGASELSLFRTLAGLIGTALEARRVAEERAERRRFEEQVALARQVQERFTPGAFAPSNTLDVSASASVCTDLSGDYCDVIHRPDGRLALIIGDVSGKGIRTALYSAETRALIRRHMRDCDSPDVALTSVNRFLAEDMEGHDFMTLFVGLIDPDSRTMVYASAGHNPPIHRHHDGRRLDLERTGPALSWWPDSTFGLSDPVTLSEGDVLLLYTDGIYESHDEEGEMYGEERLRASLDAHATGATTAQAITDGLLADLAGFLGGKQADDDVTCIVVRAR